jgi:hypothetical protein
MPGTKKFPWLSLLLVLLSYAVFGWFVAQASISWSEWIVEQGKEWGWLIEDESAYLIVELLGAGLILLIAIALAAPIALVTIFFGSWLKSETKAWISILGWAFAAVFIIRWITYFIRFLVLICAALLGRLELQSAGYNDWQTFVILALICLGGFSGGVLIFMQLGQ